MYRKIFALILSLLLAVGIIGVMLWRVWGDLNAALEYLHPVYLIPAVLICVIAWFSRGWRYKVILARLGVMVPTIFATACIYLSQTVNLLVPARLGDLIRIILVKHEYDATVSQGLSSIVVERVFDIITVAFLGLISVLFVLNVPEWALSLIVIPLVLGALFFGVLLFMGRFSSENKYLGYLLTMLNEVKEASLTPSTAIILFFSSVGIWIMDTIICVSVSAMFNQEIPLAVILLAIVAGNLIKAVPVTPGGLGTYEASLAIIFELSGVAPATATLIAVIDHLIKNLITVIGGVASIFYFGNWVVPEMMASIKRRLFDNGEEDV
ncbi:MAG TPA: lysylphosphatidylglycerol synthase transmembrane domain-containing protein [Methanospirillum sp.]|uniref:lysylphosphatidylglycerol synthase transmembrane domain-containing protein n=1 Tax=Methanospirillum sp. TaxID=45200 RepID=UPI002BC7376D|nr:lysylphosphatidylglycerol synthase transmembrane domain-containing protein [Methanospirillum sp.]HWQ65145.1 lysylphosphatidylglycerol synthase transmembrane domain-containing protein [Methanospirillum sp.]